MNIAGGFEAALGRDLCGESFVEGMDYLKAEHRTV
jgi:hypothetical protein